VVVFTPSTSPEKQNRWGLKRKEGKKYGKQAAQGFERENRDVENLVLEPLIQLLLRNKKHLLNKIKFDSLQELILQFIGARYRQ
jgi:hypothetical protein